MNQRPTACPCGGIMLADTEDWDVPRCFDCWVALGEPKYEPKHNGAAPIPMFLCCPMCGTRHIDEGEFATKIHHTHSYQKCGLTWRPAVVATVGVRFLPGFKNAHAPTRGESSQADPEKHPAAGPSAASPTGEREAVR